MLNLKYIYTQFEIIKISHSSATDISSKNPSKNVAEVTIHNANSSPDTVSLSAVFHLEEVTVRQDKSMALMECTHLTTP